MATSTDKNPDLWREMHFRSTSRAKMRIWRDFAGSCPREERPVLPIVFSDLFTRETDMTDRFLTRCWWIITMTLIAGTGLTALLSAYRGVFATFAGAYVQGGVDLLVCLPFAAAAFLLARHRVDLVCD